MEKSNNPLIGHVSTNGVYLAISTGVPIGVVRVVPPKPPPKRRQKPSEPAK